MTCGWRNEGRCGGGVADAHAGVSPLRFAPVEMTGVVGGRRRAVVCYRKRCPP